MSKSVLLEKIEECRQEMISLSDTHDLTSEVVMSSSMKLDKLINEYQNYA
ncbi:Spo0E family sporulation regulatory protein-aspartic acid phosphatase [Virgibacillus xinjiangensis]|uniref:Spo0E family sporulation regulatory protein-aspartic acid phosphatase n=1 Tax=Virgibacillus xinjiangensis TaxID=393090 RepID=A0ABV7CZD9_9BACI